MANTLRVTGGAAAGSVIEIGQELVIGRSEVGDGQLGGDPELSRRHARIHLEPGGGLAVEDLGSTNGTFVNGERLTGTRSLPPGATVQVGQTTLVVDGAADAGATEVAGALPPEGATEVAGAVPAQPPSAPQPPAAGPPPPPGPTPPPSPPSPAAAPGPPPLPPGGSAPPPPPVPGVPPPPGAHPGAHAAHPGAAPAPAKSGGPSRGLIAALVGALVLIGLGVGAFLVLGGDDKDKKEDEELRVEGPAALVSAAREAKCTTYTEASEGGQHIETPPSYKSYPPHSGDHTDAVAEDVRYTDDPPAIGELVHALEHGRVIMWHNPGDKKMSDELLDVGNQDAHHMIIAPTEEEMDYKVAATAWTHFLGCPEWNEQVPDAIAEFRDAYRDKGPEQVP